MSTSPDSPEPVAGFKQGKGQEDYLNQELLELCEYSLHNYNQYVFSLIASSLQSFKNDLVVVDFGAGRGTLSEICRENLGISPICVEIDKELQQVLKEKNFEVVEKLENIVFRPGLIFSSNVLEHIENDYSTILEIYELLDQGGSLVLYLPAFPLLYSKLDHYAGHFRRYTKKDIIGKLTNIGFEIQSVKYVDSIGFFASLLIKFIGFKSGKGLGSKASLSFYDERIFPISIRLDHLFRGRLFGKNLFISALKK